MMYSELVVFLIFFLFSFVSPKKFRFWDISLTTTVDEDLCDVFGEANIELVSPSFSCGSPSPCINTSSVPGVSCSNGSSITFIDFSNYGLQGYLPTSINLLESLRSLDLSSNSFVGTIPVEFGKSLVGLEDLDLSRNSLSGPIPSQFCAMSSLTSLKIQGDDNKFSCYDRCFLQSTISNDFLLAGLSPCSPLVDRYSLPVTTLAAFSTCTYPQNPNPSSKWTKADYCTFYHLQNCPPNAISSYGSVKVEGCPPSCLSTSKATDFCQAFALFTYGCGADTEMTKDDVNELEKNCLSSYQSSVPATTTDIYLEFSFQLLNIDADLLQADINNSTHPYRFAYDKQILIDSLNELTGYPVTFIYITELSPLPPSTASVKGYIKLSAELFNFNSDSAAAFAQSVKVTLLSVLSPDQASYSPFITSLKAFVGENPITTANIYISTPQNTVHLLSVMDVTILNLGGTYVTNSSSNTIPTISNPTVTYLVTAVPTVQPTLPTFAPSPSPMTSKPSAVPSTAVPSATPTAMTRCVDIEIADLFGDGWDTAKLVIYSSDGSTDLLAPTCEMNPIYTRQCFYSDRNADGDFVSLKVVGYQPKRPWEVYWRATNSFEGVSYAGGYDSVMTFTYREQASDDDTPRAAWIQITKAEDLIYDYYCESCVLPPAVSSSGGGSVGGVSGSIGVGSAAEKEKPEGGKRVRKYKKRPQVERPPPIGRPVGGNGGVSTPASSPSFSGVYENFFPSTTVATTPATSDLPPVETVSTSGYGSTDVAKLQEQGSSAVNTKANGYNSYSYFIPQRRSLLPQLYDLSYTLYGPGDSWRDDYGYDVKFYVSKVGQDDSFRLSGTLCNNFTAKSDLNACPGLIALEEGMYLWRVTGLLAEQKDAVKWSFCGVTGKAGAELLFRVAGETCSPQGLKYVQLSCVDPAFALAEAGVDVHVHGVIGLEGVDGPLSADETDLLRKAITQEFNDARLTNVPLPDEVTSIFPMDASNPFQRKLESDSRADQAVTFRVTLRVAKLDMVSFKAYLDKSMTSGLFVTRVKGLISVQNNNNKNNNMNKIHPDVKSLKSLSRASLLDLRIIHETLENKELSILSTTVVAVCGALGLIFASMFIVHILRRNGWKYDMLTGSDDLSTHCREMTSDLELKDGGSEHDLMRDFEGLTSR